MKPTLLRFAVVAILVFSSAAVALAADRTLSSEVKLKPMAKPGAYTATVEIRDAASGQVLAAPTIAFMKGGPANTTTKLESGEEILFTVQVNDSGSGASYTAEIRSGGRSIAVQKASIALAP